MSTGDELALVLAKCRTGGSVYMDGSHNPTPYERRAASDFLRHVLGVDPETPPEWRTPDHCLTWLRERGWDWVELVHRDVQDEWSVGLIPEDIPDWYCAPTLHAALIAACRAVTEQEAGT